MEQEIKDIITKNLPHHVGEVLKVKLAKADDDAYQVKRLESELIEKEESIRKLTSLNKELSVKILSEETLKEREKAVEERERNLEIEMLQLKLQEAEKRSNVGTELVQMIFRSPVYRKHIENMTFSNYDSQGRYNTAGAAPVNVVETTE